MRTFIALTFDNELKSRLGHIQRTLKRNAQKGSWTYINNFHLTLKFLGTTNPQHIDEIKAILGSIAQNHKLIKLSLDNLGFFPGKDIIRVAWIGLKGDMEELTTINSQVESKMNSLGFSKEKREYRPHITLGRNVVFSNTMHNVKNLIDSDMNYHFSLDNLVLMKSDEVEKKRIHTPIASFKLQIK